MGASALAWCTRGADSEHEVAVCYERAGHAILIDLVTPHQQERLSPRRPYRLSKPGALETPYELVDAREQYEARRWTLQAPSSDAASGISLKRDARVLEVAIFEFCDGNDARATASDSHAVVHWLLDRGFDCPTNAIARMHQNEARVLGELDARHATLYRRTAIAASKQTPGRSACVRFTLPEDLRTGVLHVGFVCGTSDKNSYGIYVGCFVLEALIWAGHESWRIEPKEMEQDSDYGI